MNDNVQIEGPHHALCLVTLRNLRTQLDCADLAGVQCSPGQEVFTTEHFRFWRERIDEVLRMSAGEVAALLSPADR
jgi:hypothetical protein